MTIATLSAFQLEGVRTENPGVWRREGDRKVAALGVHLRRNVSSYGVGLNVETDLRWFERIVACGLVGKGVTSMWEMLEGRGVEGGWVDPVLVGGRGDIDVSRNGEGKEDIRKKVVSGHQLDTETVGTIWVNEFAKSLYGEGGGDKLVKTSMEDVGFDRDMVDTSDRP